METEQTKLTRQKKKLHALHKFESVLEQFKYCRWGWDTVFVITVRKELEKETKEVIDVAKTKANTLGIDALRKTASYPVLVLLYFLYTQYE